MNQHKTAIATFKALALSVLALSAQAAEFVTNGNFTSTTNIGSYRGSGGQLGYNINATGWTTDGYNFLFTPTTSSTTSGTTADNGGSAGTYGKLQLWGPGNGSPNGLTNSPNGGNFIGADGAFQVKAINQTITDLVVGGKYTLSFWWAGAQQSGFNGVNTENWTASLGGQSFTTDTVYNTNHGFTGWQQATFSYTATASSEVLSFLAHGTPNGEPPFSLLDGVSLTGPTTATPLPAALFFVAPALAGVFGFSRRKQNKA